MNFKTKGPIITPASRYPKTEPWPIFFATGTNNTAAERYISAWNRKECGSIDYFKFFAGVFNSFKKLQLSKVSSSNELSLKDSKSSLYCIPYFSISGEVILCVPGTQKGERY